MPRPLVRDLTIQRLVQLTGLRGPKIDPADAEPIEPGGPA